MFIFYCLEFRSQLPHEGGAFYSSDTMDTVRKFYRDAWPPVLNAATLWLCHGGFEETGRASSTSLPHNLQNYVAQNNKSFDEINSDYFHLIFGKCVMHESVLLFLPCFDSEL